MKNKNQGNEQMTNYKQGLYVYAARYAHTRNTGAALQVVSAIVADWQLLRADTQQQLKEEAAHSATCNFNDWNKLKKLEVKK